VRVWAVANGYDFSYDGSRNGDNFPVHTINWYDAVKWCNAKSEMEGLVPVYSFNGAIFKSGLDAPTQILYANGYRLPTDAEWEWAARGGVNSQGFTFSGSNALAEVAWFNANAGNDGNPGAKMVATKKSNELGIFDMSGNVLEYCWDSSSSGWRSFRGGSWFQGAYECDVSYRYKLPPDSGGIYNNQGFRVARNEEQMVTVQGGVLPQSSGLAGQVVQSFEIGRYEVTWAEWQTVRTYAIANGYDLTGIGNGTASTHPVQNVNWYDVLKWCNAKSQMEGLMPVYTVSGATYKTGQSVPTVNASANGYRLPVEKEWEWAARGGVASQGYSYSGSNDANLVAWHSGNSGSGTKPIGLKLANELGVYDMSGNVFEWCWDEVPGVVGRRIRGGGFFVNSDSCQISLRGHPSPNNRDGYNGFRLARSVAPTIDDWLIVNLETHEVEMGVRWDGNTETWPLPAGTYAVKRKDADFSIVKYKPEEPQP
jgi:formylglycine-generating enzyme required for sulfatase activity